jgi:hypothetical protein
LTVDDNGEAISENNNVALGSEICSFVSGIREGAIVWDGTAITG